MRQPPPQARCFRRRTLVIKIGVGSLRKMGLEGEPGLSRHSNDSVRLSCWALMV